MLSDLLLINKKMIQVKNKLESTVSYDNQGKNTKSNVSIGRLE